MLVILGNPPYNGFAGMAVDDLPYSLSPGCHCRLLGVPLLQLVHCPQKVPPARCWGPWYTL